MLKNYLRIALRNMWRNKVFSLINVLGLSIGISAALVIYLIVQYDFSFETFEKDGDRVYRVVSDMHFPDQDFKNSGVSGPLVDVIRKEIPGVEESTAFWLKGDCKVNIPGSGNPGKTFKKQGRIIFTDNHYFNFLPYHWLAGSAKDACKNPNEVVLTESRARSYFPGSDISKIIGQTVVYDDSIQTTVSGVVKDLDQITDFTFKEFISLSTYTNTLNNRNGYNQWGSVSSASQLLVRLDKGSKPARIEKQIRDIREKVGKNEYLKTENSLQPLRDIHFNSNYDSFDQRLADKKVLYGLMVVATFLLLLGCINFINLTTAQSSRRAKEIGIRKTMGSSASQLILQFLGETYLLTLLATLLSVAMIPWILKLFSDFIPEGISFNLFSQSKAVGFILLLTILVSLLSGLYPAMIISRYQPAIVLKNLGYATTGQSRKAWLRKVLTVSQFAIAQFFIMATLVVGKQIRYSMNMDMGFKKAAIINFQAPFDYYHPDHKPALLLEKLKAVPGVYKVSLSGNAPASEGTNFTTMKFNKDGKTIETTVEIKDADTAYLGIYQLKLLAGRNLLQSDTSKEYLVNEAYAKFLGFQKPADIIGQYIERGDKGKIPIVGLLADFHTKSTQGLIAPLALTCDAKNHSTFHIFLGPKGKNTDNWKNTIAEVEKEWQSIYPDQDINYKFFDESIAQFYEQEQRTASLLNWCAGLTVLISCLGLLGLVIFATTQRVKEIGVRKVLGATVSQLVTLLSKDYLKLVVVAFVIAAPLAWWAMDVWLRNYAYRTSLSWWIFLVTAGSMLFLAFFTLSIQTLRSATENPVKSLRAE